MFVASGGRAATFSVTNTDSTGPGSLNAAIVSANNAGTPSLISFQIPGSGPQTIAGTLPAVSGTMTIDGTTQPGYAGSPLIEVPNGFLVTGSGCVFRGLAIGSNGLGLELDGGGSNTVTGCFIGTGPYGTNALPLVSAGIYIDGSSHNQIGGATAATRNLIWSGTNSSAVYIQSGSMGNIIEGNWIGVDVTGAKRLPGSVLCGIELDNSASNAIGAAVAGGGNVIAGTTEDAILVSGTGCLSNTIQGNFVGTDATGMVGLGNEYGIMVSFGASSNLIGGATALARNVISSNAFSAVNLWGSFFPVSGGENIVQGNMIGTDATGKHALPNGSIGVFISSSTQNVIGGEDPGEGNLISANQGPGVYLGGNSNEVSGNIIGLDITGTTSLGNTGNGVTLQGIGNEIGGDTAAAGNIISGNQVYGIYEYGGSSNYIEGNFIGTDITGQTALGNTYDGISLDGASWIWIGGTNAGEANVVAGNGTEGICIGRYAVSSNITVVGNLVGVAAPSGSRAGSVSSLKNPWRPRPNPAGNPPPYMPLCVPFDSTYGTYPLQILGIDNVCPPFPPNWISDNVFGSCNNSAVNVPNGGSFWFTGNTLICPTGTPPILSGPTPPPPTLTVNSDGSITVGGTGLPGSTLNGTLYGLNAFDPFTFYFPLQNVPIPTGSNGTGTGTVEPPLPGNGMVSAGLTAPCGGISEVGSAVSVGPVTSTTPPGTTVGNFIWSGNSGCPVSTFTGELYESPGPDLKESGPFPLRFQRYYAAWIKKDGFINGRLGDNWLHNFEMRLIPPSSNVVEVITQFGRVIQFAVSGNTYTLIGRTDVPFQLVNNGSNYILGDPFSQRLYTFDTTGSLAQIADGRGNAHTLSYSGGLLVGVSDGLGHALSFSYDSSGQLTNVSDGVRQAGFAQTGTALTSVTDPLGSVTTYAYEDTNGVTALMTTGIRPNGNAPFRQTFDSAGRVATQIEAGEAPGTNSFVYGTDSGTTTDPGANSWQDNYTALGELTNTTDPAGHALTMTYNTNGQRITVTDRLGYTTRIGYYAPSGKMAAMTNSVGGVTTFTYSSHTAAGMTFYDLAEIAYPDGTSESSTYDSQGNMLTHTDSAGNAFTFTYNARGQVLTGKNPAGGTITLTYTADGAMATRTDSDTGVTTYQYDEFRRLTNVINPDGTMAQRAYDADDRLISATDELGHVYGFSYDGNGNLKQLIDPLGNRTSCGFDARDRLIRVTNRVGAVTAFAYDARGLLVTNRSPTGDQTTFAYDSRRRPSTATDPIGNAWNMNYDNEDFLEFATNPSGETSTMSYNAMGLVTNTADPLAERTAMSRDAMQRITSSMDPLTRTNGYAYEARGELTAATRQGIGAAAYTRDAMGLVSKIVDLNSNTWSLTYTPMGRLASVTDPLGRRRGLNYDNRGRLQNVLFQDGSDCTNVYDAAGNPTDIEYSGGLKFHYTYDALNRVATAGDIGLAFDAEGELTNTASSGVNFGAAYDASGRLTSVSYFNGGFKVTYAYDRRGLLTNVTDSLTGARVALSYDGSDRLISLTRGNGVNGSYSYDATGRLTSLQEGGLINIQFGLDAAGEIKQETFTAPIDPATGQTPALAHLGYDAADQILGGGYAYDARGRLTASPGHAFAWDAATRLVAIDGVTLGYNGCNQVVTRTQSGVTTRYFYNHAIGFKPIMAERNEATGQILRYYVWSPGGRLLYMIDATAGNAVSYYHFDQAGSTLALTGANGTMTDAYAYSPYGKLLGHNGSSAQPFTFIGEFGVRSEPAAGLYDMRARYYDPQTARFLSADTVWPRLSQPDALDPYEYAMRDPLRLVDPGGQCEPTGANVTSWTGFAFDGAAGAFLYAANNAQTASEAANSEAARLVEFGTSQVFDWYEGFLNGTIAMEGEEGDLVYEAYSEEQAIQRIDFLFGGTPGNPFMEGEAFDIRPEVGFQAKKWWWSNLNKDVATLETEGVELSQRASALRSVGTGLAVVGITLQTGAAVYEDYKNGAGVVVTATDAASTVSANAAMMAAPPLAIVDLATGGTISGGIHNALMTPNTVARVALGRVSTRDADAIKTTYTRFAVGRWAWYAGEYWYSFFTGGPPPE